MKHPILLFVAAVGMLLSASACTAGTSDAEMLAAADSMIVNGDYNAAQKICDRLQPRALDGKLSVAQTGHLSLLYISLSEANENADQIDNITSATKCYMKAFEIAPDSAIAYFQNLSDVNQLRMWGVLNFLANPSYEVPAELDSLSCANIDSTAFDSEETH